MHEETAPRDLRVDPAAASVRYVEGKVTALRRRFKRLLKDGGTTPAPAASARRFRVRCSESSVSSEPEELPPPPVVLVKFESSVLLDWSRLLRFITYTLRMCVCVRVRACACVYAT